MLPHLELGGLRLTTYAVMWGLAILVAGTFAFGRMVRHGIPAHLASRGTLLAIWGGILGQIVVGTLKGLLEGASLGQPLSIQAGNNIFGFLLGAALPMSLYWRRQDVSPRRVADAALVAVPLAEAIGRLGCLGAGCCYGQVTDSSLGLYLPDPYGVWATRYPTQMLSSLGGLTAFLMALGFEGLRKYAWHKPIDWPFPGFASLLCLELFALQRLIIESMRADPALIGPFHLGHLFAGGILIAASAAIVSRLAPKRA